MKCPVCKIEMKLLFNSWYCPQDCDKINNEITDSYKICLNCGVFLDKDDFRSYCTTCIQNKSNGII